MEKTQYRIVADWMGIQNLQFKSTFKILWIWSITVWRYVPSTYVARVFTEKKCPWLYLPFSTSHCYVGSFNSKKVIEFSTQNSNVIEWLAKLKNQYIQTYSTKYL